MSAASVPPGVFFQLPCSCLAFAGFREQCAQREQQDKWHSQQDTQQVEEPEAPREGGSQ